jgi:hypothetical protein
MGPKTPVWRTRNPVSVAPDDASVLCLRSRAVTASDVQKDAAVKEWFYEKNTLGNGAVWDIAIWPIRKQTFS